MFEEKESVSFKGEDAVFVGVRRLRFVLDGEGGY